MSPYAPPPVWLAGQDQRSRLHSNMDSGCVAEVFADSQNRVRARLSIADGRCIRESKRLDGTCRD